MLQVGYSILYIQYILRVVEVMQCITDSCCCVLWCAMQYVSCFVVVSSVNTVNTILLSNINKVPRCGPSYTRVSPKNVAIRGEYQI